MHLSALIAVQITQHHPDAVFIDAGAGSGVIDRLRQLGHSVIEVNFGGKADSPRFQNRRSEMWAKTAIWLKQGGAIPNHQGLKQDLATPLYSYDSANRICLESKDQIRKRLLRSPDEGDALALTFAFPVSPRRNAFNELIPQKRKTLDNWNPLEDSQPSYLFGD